MAVVPLVMATLVMAQVAAADGYICVFSTRCYEGLVVAMIHQ